MNTITRKNRKRTDRSTTVSRQVNKRNNRNNSGRSKQKATIDVSLLVKKANLTEQKEYIAERTIDQLPVSSQLVSCLTKKGFKTPTEIQDRTIDSLLAGKDLLGIAQTGTGKTGAFLIPVIQQLLTKKTNPFALVVVPTRELALQVEEEFKTMTKGLNLFSACFIGGTNINRDLQTLRRSSHVVIGTPGRLLDLVNRRVLDLRKFNTLILDEFDRMLDMGFVNDVKRILYGMQQRKHTMLFSATLDSTQQSLINSILHEPVTVKVSNGTSSADHVDQDIVRLKEGEDKFGVLTNMLTSEDFKRVIIFDETKHRVNRLCKKLNNAGIVAEQIHGDKTQNARQKALQAFKKGESQVLVATDVAARGIDVSDVSHVVNYQIPTSYDSYIHRIGRTGRAGKIGKALTLIDFK
eukprot:gnl/MRDRNA2_/MRDRNA2_34718_c0_seq1.p1 gnl/MRDRNA2_/MRDRNA2_34718_c0~~gnl/MRDRNA2_/MRDRNA2_34718_c0_seq1.p1  ORF type:complete len:408 (-),score=-6.21 gnl/MRDRNA2_/MRDRNA2_34718_c0_seq1:670-1893(-)